MQRMLGWLLLLGEGLMLPLAAAYLCDGRPVGTLLCDPASNGAKYFVCMGFKRPPHHMSCPHGLVFDVHKEVCTWHRDAQSCSRADLCGPNTLADECNAKTCQLPECRCAGTDIPGGIPVSQVPQMVVVTFDDQIGEDSFRYYPQLFWEREGGVLRNPNNATIGATFFVTTKGTNLDYVKIIWRHGHELASHSRTHSRPANWTLSTWFGEMQNTRIKLANAVGTSTSEIRGLRTPFVDLGGDLQFLMMEFSKFLYDSSFIVVPRPHDPTSTLIWPFSLRYPPAHQVCAQGNCPQRSFPGLWEVPLLPQYSLQGEPCVVTDLCKLPDDATPAVVTNFLRQNFLRHFHGNRAPYVMPLHTPWFSKVPGSLQGLKDFLAEINAIPQVWLVTTSQMLDWVRHPVPLSRIHELASWRPREIGGLPAGLSLHVPTLQ